jgi:flagellin-like protein
MRKVSRRAKEEGVSPVIATILMVAITVVLSAVLYVIVSELMKPGQRMEHIGMACTQIGSTMNYKCVIVSGSGVDFAKVNVQVRDDQGTTVANWSAPVQFVNGEQQSYMKKNPIASAKIVDNGDGQFGVGDDIFLTPVSGGTLVGLSVKISGGGGDGSANI